MTIFLLVSFGNGTIPSRSKILLALFQEPLANSGRPELSKLPIRSAAGSISLISSCKHSSDEVPSFWRYFSLSSRSMPVHWASVTVRWALATYYSLNVSPSLRDVLFVQSNSFMPIAIHMWAVASSFIHLLFFDFVFKKLRCCFLARYRVKYGWARQVGTLPVFLFTTLLLW